VVAAFAILIAASPVSAIFAYAEQRIAFSGVYDIRRSYELEHGFQVALVFRISNRTETAQREIIARLLTAPFEPESSSAFYIQTIGPHGEATFETELFVPRDQYQGWNQEGGGPHLAIEVFGERAGTDPVELTLSREPIQLMRRPEGAGVTGEHQLEPAQTALQSAVMETVAGSGPDGIPATAANII